MIRGGDHDALAQSTIVTATPDQVLGGARRVPT
jgi:hypothetical protein